MSFARGIAASIAAIMLPAAAVAQPDYASMEFESHDLGGGVHMLAGGGGNIGLLVGDDGVIMIDDGYTPLSDKLLAAVAEVSDEPVSYVLNTHWHFDHVGSNEAVADSGAVIVAHHNVRERMSSKQFIEALDMRFEPSPPGALPVVTFAAEMKLHLNDDEIRIRHIHHAHTDGDAVIFIEKANVIHAGDTYWNGFYPLIDTSSGGSIEGLIRAADAMLAVADEDTKIIPGHGPLSNKAELTAYRDMLVKVRGRVLAMLERGFSKGAALKAQALNDLNEEWGDGFVDPDKFLGIVYEDLAAK